MKKEKSETEGESLRRCCARLSWKNNQARSFETLSLGNRKVSRGSNSCLSPKEATAIRESIEPIYPPYPSLLPPQPHGSSAKSLADVARPQTLCTRSSDRDKAGGVRADVFCLPGSFPCLFVAMIRKLLPLH